MYRYKVTVEALSENAAEPRLEFEVVNHDDIMVVAKRLDGKLGLDENSTRALAVGMKLFGETILQNREHPLFQPMKSAFGEFMRHLKQAI